MTKNKIIIFFIAIFLTSIIFSTLNGAAKVKIPKKVLKIEKKADKAKNKKDFAKAIELYKSAIDIYPDYYKVHYSLASIYAFNKKYPEAIKELKIAKKLNNKNDNITKALLDTLLKEGNSLLKTRKIKEATNYFLEMFNVNGFQKVFPKGHTEMMYRIGFNYFVLRDVNNSLKYLEKFLGVADVATNFTKYYTMANYISGINYSTKKDYEKSNKYLKKFIDLTKSDLNNKYSVFAKYIVASNYFAELKPKVTEIKKTTNQKNIKANKKKIRELASKYTEIETNLNEVIQKNPKLEDAYVILGNFYYLKEDLGNCIKTYKSLISSFPNSKDIDIYKEFLKGVEKTKK